MLLNPESKVTLIITACNRPALLLKTLQSFFNNYTYAVADIIVYEDSGLPDVNNAVKKTYPFVRFIEPTKRTGQIVAHDSLMAEVKTEYVLSWEEDWETYKAGFTERAMQILAAEPNTLQVLFRHPADNNGHPTMQGGINHRYLSTSYHWKGFSFSPSLKRKADYDLIGSFGQHTSFNPAIPWASEKAIGEVYYALGYRVAILRTGYVRHIGKFHHVNPLKQ